jgi:hypothetical protein
LAKKNAEDIVVGFAEDLGRLLGTTERKAAEWLGQREKIAEQLTNIRDTASKYLQQLTAATSATRLQGRARTSQSAAATPTGRKRKRRSMTAAQRKAVGERMKKYWAARRKAESKLAK